MRLLIIGGLSGQLSAAAKIAMDRGAKVAIAQDIETALSGLRKGQGADLLMVDVQLSIVELIAALENERIAVPVVACGVKADADAAVAAIRAGAKEYIPLPPDADLIAAVLEAVAEESGDLIAADPAMKKVIALADQVAASEASILITGESGVGKEVIAKYLHEQIDGAQKNRLSRSTAPPFRRTFWNRSCSVMKKGRFTGRGRPAHRQVRRSQWRHTVCSTRFPKWIFDLQAKLLARLAGAHCRPGWRFGKPINVDIRVIATSNRNLEEEVKKGNIPGRPSLPA